MTEHNVLYVYGFTWNANNFQNIGKDYYFFAYVTMMN